MIFPLDNKNQVVNLDFPFKDLEGQSLHDTIQVSRCYILVGQGDMRNPLIGRVEKNWMNGNPFQLFL